jgi:carboxylate-amine ligase
MASERALSAPAEAPLPAPAVVSAVEPSFRFGIEEEYFLVDAATRRIAPAPPDEVFRNANLATAGSVDREFLRSQVEAATPPYLRANDARNELQYIRRVTTAFAADKGLAILACGTHPQAAWSETLQSDSARYDAVMAELQMIGRRNLLCGMHVHVEFADPSLRVDVMARMLPYLPLLLALSTSSPFWQGQATGLKGYRLAAYDELPRTGLPDLFRTQDDLDRYTQAMVKSGIIEDASYLWWAIRPSTKYPTLELRIADCCTRIEDALAIACLYRALVRHLCLNPKLHDDIDIVDRALAVENKWRAQRYGVHATFATKDGSRSVGDLLEDTLTRISDDIDRLDCRQDVEHSRVIVRDGTSADVQLAIYHSVSSREGHARGLQAALDWIAQTTLID